MIALPQRVAEVEPVAITQVSRGQIAFAIGMIASGILNVANRGFYSPWDPIPTWIPAHAFLAYALGAIMVLGGVGLALRQTAALSARVLLASLLVFLVLFKTPVFLSRVRLEVSWLDYGELAVLVAGAWTLATTNEQHLRAARYLLGASLIPIGLSHFFYIKIATAMVPAVLPFRPDIVIFTGIAHIAAGLGVLSGVYARLAAILEASMLTAFATLVWLAPVIAKPGDLNLWSSLVVTVAVANGVWAVASKMTVPISNVAGFRHSRAGRAAG
jgi:uncharacterized membrane protein